jgi:hypothetical protein
MKIQWLLIRNGFGMRKVARNFTNLTIVERKGVMTIVIVMEAGITAILRSYCTRGIKTEENLVVEVSTND